jgi:hypothetical protein
MGIRHVACLSNFGNMARDAVEESMRLMMEEVMPKVEARIAQRAAA